MTRYLIEVSLIHVTLISAYWLFLRQERQYSPMRFYLLGAALLALATPLLHLPRLLFGSMEVVDAIWLQPVSLEIPTITPATGNSFWSANLLISFYMVISAFLLIRLLAGIFYLVWLERRSSFERREDMVIRRSTDVDGSFTFFHWIFLSDQIANDQPDYEVILKHEKAHASLGHTYDLLFFELFKVCFWWLPTSWFALKEIKKIHEYQADAYALKTCNVDRYSSILISSVLKSNGLSLASSFHDGLILKRLKAMKQEAKKVSPWKLGVLGALSAMLFIVFACNEDTAKQAGENNVANAHGEIFTMVEELPQYPGGMDALYQYVRREIKYPKEARVNGVEGRVNVQFVIEKDGSISHVEAIGGIGSGCDEEAVRVVKNMASFSPGLQHGKAVRVRMVMPIVFKIDAGKTNPDNTAQGAIIIEKAQVNGGKLNVDAHFADGEWSGTVYSPEGDVLPGVSIIVAGTTTGTVTDLNGRFKVKADASKELYLSFVGYETVRLAGK